MSVLKTLCNTFSHCGASRRTRIGTCCEAANLAQSECLEPRRLLTAVLELSSLNGVNGFQLNGGHALEGSGASVSNAGDINGDGFDDVVVGAPRNSFGEAGAYVVFGKPGGFDPSFNLGILDGTNGFRLTGFGIEKAGLAVSSAGDFNGDGYSDLIIGAPGVNSPGVDDAGESYVVFGKANGFPAEIELKTLDGTDGFRLIGVAEDDHSGRSVSNAGDVNGDGYDDLIIGAYGQVSFSSHNGIGQSYVVFGHPGPSASTIELGSLNGTNGFRVVGNEDDHAGVSVSGAGDVNGDGFDDVIIGADCADFPELLDFSSLRSGGGYVVFGKSEPFAATIKLKELNGTNGFRLTGAGQDDLLGRSVSDAGDVNGDGFGDLIVGASGAPASGNDLGESYVVFGKSGGFTSSISVTSLNGSNGFRIKGISEDDFSGSSVASAGDVNADGFDDLIIGAFQVFPRGERTGESYILFGSPERFPGTINLSTLDGTNGFRIKGIFPGDLVGNSVSTAGDLNGDGFADVIIGAPGADPQDVDRAGESYVIFGGVFSGGSETQVGDGNANTLTANQGPNAIDILVGGLNDDTLISDGGDDVLSGGEGNDILSIPDSNFTGTRRLLGGDGIDTVRLTGSATTLDLTAIRDNQIVDIEIIDITGTGNNALRLDYLSVINLSSHSNTLVVLRDAGDTVDFGNGWTQQADAIIDGANFEIFVQGAATLKVQSTATFDICDVNRDGLCNTADLSAVRGQLLLKFADDSYVIPERFDLNQDSIINTADLSAERGHLLSLLAESQAARPAGPVVEITPALPSFVAVPNNLGDDGSLELIELRGEESTVDIDRMSAVEPVATDDRSGEEGAFDEVYSEEQIDEEHPDEDRSANDSAFLTSEIAGTMASIS